MKENLPEDISKELNMLRHALEGGRGKDQRLIAETGLKVITTLLRKNKDYGSSVWYSPLLTPRLNVNEAILVRMSDKVCRLKSLALEPAEVKSESFNDTMLDLAGYAILYVARPTTEYKYDSATSDRDTESNHQPVQVRPRPE